MKKKAKISGAELENIMKNADVAFEQMRKEAYSLVDRYIVELRKRFMKSAWNKSNIAQVEEMKFNAYIKPKVTLNGKQIVIDESVIDC